MRNYWKIVVIIFGLSYGIGAFIFFSVSPKFKSESVILPLSPKSSGISETGIGALVGSSSSGIGGLSDVIGGGDSKSSAGPTPLLLAILHSKFIAEAVIKKENLEMMLLPKLFKDGKRIDLSSEETMELAIEKMTEKVITAKKAERMPTIEVSCTLPDNEVAQRTLKRYLVELQDFISNNATTLASRNREFAAVEFQKSRSDLLAISRDTADFYTKNLATPTRRITVDLKTRDARLPALAVPDVPANVYYEFQQSSKKIAMETANFLAKEYTSAKLTEAKEGLSFQIIDAPTKPTRKFFPQVPMFFFISTFLAFAITWLTVFIFERNKSSSRAPIST